MVRCTGDLGAGVKRLPLLSCAIPFPLAALPYAGEASGQVPVRDLSGYGGPGSQFAVTIVVNAPPGTGVAGLEDAPPAGWTVGSISDGGTWDSLNQKVKWGPYFDASIPVEVGFDVTVPQQISGPQCFSGLASFDGQDAEIGGAVCLNQSVPATSTMGVIIMALSTIAAASIGIGRRSAGPRSRRAASRDTTL